jgi:hypothetical protein
MNFLVLSQTCQTALLDLGQGAAAAQEGDNADDTSGRQSLEEVPACVVQEEYALHSDDRSVKQGVRNGRRTEGLAGVADVGTKCRPETEQNGERGSDSSGEDESDNLGR